MSGFLLHGRECIPAVSAAYTEDSPIAGVLQLLRQSRATEIENQNL
jgi:hypothetical protein